MTLWMKNAHFHHKVDSFQDIPVVVGSIRFVSKGGGERIAAGWGESRRSFAYSLINGPQTRCILEELRRPSLFLNSTTLCSRLGGAYGFLRAASSTLIKRNVYSWNYDDRHSFFAQRLLALALVVPIGITLAVVPRALWIRCSTTSPPPS